MATEQNKAIVCRLYEALDRNDQVALDALLAPDYVDHTLPPGIPPPATGKQVAVEQVYIGRIVGGTIAEHWGQDDALALMQQVGAIPASVGTA
jgi:ketosteroid isomerase-like protein